MARNLTRTMMAPNPSKDWHKGAHRRYNKRLSEDLSAGHRGGAEYWQGATSAEARSLAQHNPGASYHKLARDYYETAYQEAVKSGASRYTKDRMRELRREHQSMIKMSLDKKHRDENISYMKTRLRTSSVRKNPFFPDNNPTKQWLSKFKQTFKKTQGRWPVDREIELGIKEHKRGSSILDCVFMAKPVDWKSKGVTFKEADLARKEFARGKKYVVILPFGEGENLYVKTFNQAKEFIKEYGKGTQAVKLDLWLAAIIARGEDIVGLEKTINKSLIKNKSRKRKGAKKNPLLMVMPNKKVYYIVEWYNTRTKEWSKKIFKLKKNADKFADKISDRKEIKAVEISRSDKGPMRHNSSKRIRKNPLLMVVGNKGKSSKGSTPAIIKKLEKIVREKTPARIDGIIVNVHSASAMLKIYKGLSVANRKKFAALTLGRMATTAFELAKNPGCAVTVPKRGKITVKRKAKGKVKRNRGDSMDDLMRDPEFKKAWKLYKQIHGCEPSSIKRTILPIGNKDVSSRGFFVSMGKTPAESYQPYQEDSQKFGNTWVHPYDNPPEKVVSADGKTIITLPGTHKVSAGSDGEAWIDGN